MMETETLSDKLVSKTDMGARAILFRCLDKITTGSLILEEKFGDSGHGNQFVFGAMHQQAVSAHVVIKEPKTYSRLLKGGSISAAEAYMDGWWETSDLTAVMRLMATNLNALDDFESRASWLTNCFYKVSHWFNRNSVGQAKQNIHAHYDLGNEMYQLFLDHHMLYSSGIFHQDNESLDQAQINKMQRLCRQLDLQASDHVIEIGTGWGAMAIYMAQQFGCQVTTTTISDAQFAYVKARIKALGLEGQITLLKQDYRLLQGQFDKLVSIEMIEAVGKAYLSTFIEKCNALLKPGGRMAIQAITIADQRFESYSRNVDFIQKYIFPGGFLPSVTTLLHATTQRSRLVVRDIRDIGLDYAKTLKQWRLRFESRLDQVSALGYDTRFIRMWRYYFCYCEGGFMERGISTVQMTFEKQS